jgi:predicted Ser/Thr protein kinase
VEALTALVARLLGGLRGLTADAVCPGSWPWAVSLLGVGVGLLPAAGAVAVALWRRRVGSRYGFMGTLVLVGTGLIAGGLAPLLVFVATGRVFAAAADGGPVTGLSARELRSLDTAVCLVGPQSSYLGEGSVAGAFSPDGPVRIGLAVLALVAMPLVAAAFTAASARLALRRGPRWPVRLFWLPLLSVVVLTADTPAGSAGHLWLGAAAGAFLGMPMVLAVGAPDRAVVQRSLAPRRPPEGARRPSGVGASRRGGGGGTGARAPAGTIGRPAASAGGASAGSVGAGSAGAGSAGAAAGGAAAGGVGLAGARPVAQGLAQRLAARFAARAPEPLVSSAPVAPSTSSAVAGSANVSTRAAPGTVRAVGGRGAPRPTLVVPGGMAAAAQATPPVLAPAAPRSAPGPARFRLVRRLGSGGFGRVWLAHDARLGHTVALKAAHVRDGDTEERIRREARALAAVRHPHCVRIHDLVPADGDPGLAALEGMVIVMEYVRGESLGELVRAHGTVDDVAAARVWSSIAGALDAAHDRGVLHRDVKPGNVVVDADGQAHLIDFGIARQAGDATLTATGFVLGTPDFLPPEIAAGGRATPAADSWQLAATVAYALTGHPPRGDHTDAVSGLRAAALGGPPTHLPPQSAHLALLRAALDADPARRPPLQAVHRALDDWLRAVGHRPGGPVTARPYAR